MKHLQKAFVAAGIAGLAFAGTPASAAHIFTFDEEGDTASVTFSGQASGDPAPDISALLGLTLTDISDNGLTYTFSYNLSNTSAVSSRIRSFGFDVENGDLDGATAGGGVYSNVNFDNNFPEGVGTLDVCFAASGGNNCTGGPNGLLSGQSTDGTFTLALNAPVDGLQLSYFTTRFQSISPAVNGATSGVGIGAMTPAVPAVPEPSTWAMMLLGFFGVGAIMRRPAKAKRFSVAYS